ncbi:hypothetical protein PQR62_01075 [Herbaspirillum lusitanum]|uniref:DUF1049 domain-containing protein n=1 Tax=Herbaspirillum lusitanum TaxID=213312 RepID=A0ABW9A379_9BURK
MRRKLLKFLDKNLDALPKLALLFALTLVVCVFSGALREVLQRADMDILAGAVALLPLTAALLALSLGMRGNAARQKVRRQQDRRKQALLQATFDVENRDA